MRRELRSITAEHIRNILRGKAPDCDKQHHLLQVLQRHNDEVCALINKGYALGTLVRLRTVWKHTNAYLKEIADLCGIEKHLTFHINLMVFAVDE